MAKNKERCEEKEIKDVLYCPQCGKQGVSYYETGKDRFRLKCEKCGEFNVREDGKYGLFVEELKVPFLINAKDNAATKYHNFDCSDYSDEKEAIVEKIKLADKILETLDATTLYGYSDEVYTEYLGLLEKAVSLEMKEYFGDYLFEIMDDFVDAAADGKKYDVAKIKHLYENSDFETKCITGMEICAMNGCVDCGISNEFVYDSLYQSRKDDDLDKDPEQYC